MENQSNFEIAQQRLQRRARTRNVFYIWLGIFLVLSLLTVATVPLGPGCVYLVPITVLVGLVTLAKGIQVYFGAPGRSLPMPLIEQEMTWLYGEDWRDNSGAQEYTFAQDRIRKRWGERWRFGLHLLLFAPVNAWLLSLVMTFIQYNESGWIWLIVFQATWLMLLLRNAVYAFPTAGMLRRRERAASQALEFELQSLQPDKQKRGEMPKHLVLADDGELVEIPETPDEPDEKLKRIT